ncbi:MAG TPA: hypothetical protein VKZ49_19465 [Polyangiaceae bacterium]|nr:hypothetical protein [Polyangiaceae bacterium]
MAWARRLGVTVALFAPVACSWWRFDEIETDTPVVLLDAPARLSGGFGSVLAATTLGPRTQLLVGGGGPSAGAAVFDLSSRKAPTTDAVGTDYCDPEAPCWLSARPVGLPLGHSGAESPALCFAVGLGRASNDATGVVVRCEQRFSYALAVPPEVDTDVVQPALAGAAPPVSVMAADGAERPALLVALPEREQAWFYAPDSLEPVPLAAPAPEPSFGRAAAVLSDGSTRVFALAAPDAGRVHLFRGVDGGAEPLGCIAGPPGFGRALAAGPATGDGADDLAVATLDAVHVFDGAELFGLPAATDAECRIDAAAAPIVLGCRPGGNVGSCERANFGAAVALGDLDGDGDGEALVGAPQIEARGNAGAGAVFVFDLEGDAVDQPTDVEFVASDESSTFLGTSLLAARVENSAVVVAGMPGAGAAAVFYCSRLLSGQDRGLRCD